MAKGHRSQIKRERNANQKRTAGNRFPAVPVFLMKFSPEVFAKTGQRLSSPHTTLKSALSGRSPAFAPASTVKSPGSTTQ